MEALSRKMWSANRGKRAKLDRKKSRPQYLGMKTALRSPYDVPKKEVVPPLQAYAIRMNTTPENEKRFEINKGQAVECIDFRMKNGDRVAFPYSYLLRAKLRGAGELEVTFSTDEVKVEGTNFDRIYPALLEKRLVFLQEQDELAPSEENDVSVKKITINPRE